MSGPRSAVQRRVLTASLLASTLGLASNALADDKSKAASSGDAWFDVPATDYPPVVSGEPASGLGPRAPTEDATPRDERAAPALPPLRAPVDERQGYAGPPLHDVYFEPDPPTLRLLQLSGQLPVEQL